MFVSLLRTLILYAIVMLAIKFMGKRQISELQTSELVIMFLMSDIAAIPMQNTSQPLVSGLIPIAVLICCEMFISVLMMKFPNFKSFLCGNAVIVINDGKINQRMLKELRMDAEDLLEQLRQVNVFSIKDIAYAIVETNGKLSVIKKSEKQPPDANTLEVNVPSAVLETVVVCNGNINNSSLDMCSLSESWLREILKKENILLEDIFLMTANKNKEFNIIKKNQGES
ncbi:MAG: DUF421 domain-containing protein [Candidatus Improbicoccus pseudotrichonymphae]|uniref:DUF421 domain-containing protein n=1 Tax=Candidatus Improbicoccus pseudotrichonymphae TaxID=3033792 RepID=A0AA48I561_9FIRM|nr:MAG: DUF421 domain-containing protein [Candidatus Improbicoccus pseudotrichonymphae]